MELIESWGVGNDISDQWWQGNGGGKWIKGKSGPGFTPHNIDLKSFTPNFNLNRQIKCLVNDKLMQDSSLNEYIFAPGWLV
ncbi:fumarylacetoacetate hydrolase family protein, partial [Synechococcus lacustris]|uniref:fumarylacetoacetate hydrolase family protein n=1 Tax=Synechococcus lacustris TaxID=2116544 RepID=UPI00333EA1A7